MAEARAHGQSPALGRSSSPRPKPGPWQSSPGTTSWALVVRPFLTHPSDIATLHTENASIAQNRVFSRINALRAQNTHFPADSACFARSKNSEKINSKFPSLFLLWFLLQKAHFLDDLGEVHFGIAKHAFYQGFCFVLVLRAENMCFLDCICNFQSLAFPNCYTSRTFGAWCLKTATLHALSAHGGVTWAGGNYIGNVYMAEHGMARAWRQLDPKP